MNSTSCHVCPFECGVDRTTRFGVCRLPNEILVSHAQAHFFEEPFISGELEIEFEELKNRARTRTGGSGAIFFTGCNGRCVFCQNYKISDPALWKEAKLLARGEEGLLEVCQKLIDQGVHNLNFVSPTPYSDLLAGFLAKHKRELKVPIVWNSNGYEKVESLKRLEGLVDVYLPDLKYFDDGLAAKYSGFRDYFRHATAALAEMHRQVGFPQLGDDGFIRKGLVIRHMVLPGCLEDSKKVLDWIRETLGPKAQVSLMAQYYPTYKAEQYPEVNRRLIQAEYDSISDYFFNLGFEEGLVQDLESADEAYTPEF